MFLLKLIGGRSIKPALLAGSNNPGQNAEPFQTADRRGLLSGLNRLFDQSERGNSVYHANLILSPIICTVIEHKTRSSSCLIISFKNNSKLMSWGWTLKQKKFVKLWKQHSAFVDHKGSTSTDWKKRNAEEKLPGHLINASILHQSNLKRNICKENQMWCNYTPLQSTVSPLNLPESLCQL